jgi:glycosyltransferase involved in cell wall biosynthesis
MAPHVPLVLRASSHPLRPIPWSQPRRRLKESVERRIRAKCYARSDAVIAVGEDVAAAVRRLARGVPVSVVHNPVITANFRAGATRPITLPWDEDAGTPLIISIGRVHRAKDFPTLLRAFARLRQERPARLVIIGSGFASREGKAIGSLIDGLGVAADVALVEPTSAVAAWLARSDLFVSSSLWEGSPGVLIEAMAMGCPVVATDCPGGSREVLQDGRVGRLVPIRDPREMARAMALALDQPTPADMLQAASKPYWEEGRAEEYLAAVDLCVRTAADSYPRQRCA